MIDNKILLALRALKKPSVLRKIEDKQLNIWVKLMTTVRELLRGDHP